MGGTACAILERVPKDRLLATARHTCFPAAQLKTYTFGTEEACLGESVRSEFVASEGSFLDYWTSLAAKPHFTRRRAR